MKCPHCNEFAPDNNYKCPHCGKVLKQAVTPADFRKKPVKRRRINPNIIILLIIVVGVAVLIYAAFFKRKGAGRINVDTEISTTSSGGAPSVGYLINKDNPGQEIDIRRFVQRDKTTIFAFYSESDSSQRIFSMLMRLDSNREDIIIHRVDINRPGIQGIDWESPLARQYNLRSVPYLMIYDPSGNLTHKGQDAYDEVMRLIRGK